MDEQSKCFALESFTIHIDCSETPKFFVNFVNITNIQCPIVLDITVLNQERQQAAP